MKKLLLLCVACLLAFNVLHAQKFTLSGYIKDAGSGEFLPGATVYIPKLRIGTTTNSYGFYSLSIPADSQLIVFSFVGFDPQIKKILLTSDLHLNVNLRQSNYELGEVVITTNKAKENVERPTMGVIDVPIQQIQELPAIMGEKDVFKILQLLPGVQSGSEASAGFYVRGGGADQNLILLDEAVIYNPFHLAGFFSSFNADALKSVTLTKGGFPAQYGGRLSSVVDVSMKDGNDKELHGSGGIGVIASRLTLEGPLVKERSSFMVSARRTYIDALIRPFLPVGIDAAYYFYDLNAKLNYRFSDKDRIYLSGYIGKDVAKASQRDLYDTVKLQTDWGNKTLTARWNHLFNNKLFSNASFVYNDYAFRILAGQNSINAKLISAIRDYNGKVDFDYFPSNLHKVKFGVNYTYHNFIPSLIEGSSPDIEFTNKQEKFVHEAASYVQDEYTYSEDFSVNFGVRVPFFVYKTTQYSGVEPRLTLKYSIDKRTSLKAGYTWMNQYVHLVTNSTIASPMDLWIPSSDVIKPQKAQQIAAGVFRNWFNDRYESSVEVYYKTMDNLIEYKEGANVFLNDDIDQTLTFGKGWSYGAEFFIKKSEGKITGFVGYTLSWSTRKFPELNNNKIFPAKYDRRHDLAVTGVYKFNDKWSFSAVFVFGSGNSMSVPFGKYTIPIGAGNAYMEGMDYVEKNFYKLRPYNRLDVGIKYIKEKKGKWQSDWRFDIYNVYSRRNPYFVYMTTERDAYSNVLKPVAKQVSIFPIIPSLSYNFNF